MKKFTITDAWLRSPPPSQERIEVRDEAEPALVVRIAPTRGRRATFYAIYRLPGQGPVSAVTGKRKARQIRRMIGSYPAMSLGQARSRAEELFLAARDHGRDLFQEQLDADLAAERKAAEDARAAGLLADETAFCKLWPLHLEYRKKRAKTWSTYEALYNRHIKGTELDRTPVSLVTKKTLRTFLDDLEARKTPAVAHEVHAKILRSFFNWCAEQGHIEIDPGAGMTSGYQTQPKGRVLDETEIKLYWKAAGAQPYPRGPHFRILMLTGMRRGEAGGLTMQEIDLKKGWITLRADRFKTGVQQNLGARAVYTLPITKMLREVIEEAIETRALLDPKGPYLFTERGAQCQRPPASYSKAGQWRQRWVAKYVEEHMPGYNLPPAPRDHHDLRHTVHTIMDELGIPAEVIAACLGQSQGGMRKIYSHSAYRDQKVEAYTKYHGHLAELIK